MHSSNQRYVPSGAGLAPLSTKNLNAYTRAPARPTGAPHRGSMQVLGGKHDKLRGLKAAGVAAAPTPLPLNTPSLRRENNGKDISTVLVPVGAQVWGAKTEEQPTSVAPSVPVAPALPQQTAAANSSGLAPWAQKKEDEASSAPVSRRHRSWVELESDEEDEEEEGEQQQHVAPVAPAAVPLKQVPSALQSQQQQQQQSGVGLKSAPLEPQRSVKDYSAVSSRLSADSSRVGYSDRDREREYDDSGAYYPQQQQSRYQQDVRYQGNGGWGRGRYDGEYERDFRNRASMDVRPGHHDDDKIWRQRVHRSDLEDAEKLAAEASRIEREELELRRRRQQQPQTQVPERMQRDDIGRSRMPPRHGDAEEGDWMRTRQGLSDRIQVSSIVSRSTRAHSANEDAEQNLQYRNGNNGDVVRGESGRQKMLYDPKTGKYASSDKLVPNVTAKKVDMAAVKPHGSKKGSSAGSEPVTQSGAVNIVAPSVLTRSSQDREAVVQAAQAQQRERAASEAQRMRELRAAERAARGPRTKGVLFVYNESNMFEQVLTEAEKVEQEQKRRERDAAKGTKAPQKQSRDVNKPPLSAQPSSISAFSFAKNAGAEHLSADASAATLSDMLQSKFKPSTSAMNNMAIKPPIPASAPPLIPAWTTRQMTLSALDMLQTSDVIPSAQSTIQPSVQQLTQPIVSSIVHSSIHPSDEFDILREAVPQLEGGNVVGSGTLRRQTDAGLGLGHGLGLNYPSSTMSPLSSEFVPGVGWISSERQQYIMESMDQHTEWQPNMYESNKIERRPRGSAKRSDREKERPPKASKGKPSAKLGGGGGGGGGADATEIEAVPDEITSKPAGSKQIKKEGKSNPSGGAKAKPVLVGTEENDAAARASVKRKGQRGPPAVPPPAVKAT